MALTKEAARTMLENMAAEADKATFYSGIFTIVKEGVNGVTPKEVPAFVAALATEVQVERIGKMLPGGSVETFAKRFRVLAGIVKEMKDGPSGDAAASASPVTGSAPAADDIEARMDRAVSRGPAPDDLVVGSGSGGGGGGGEAPALAAPSSGPLSDAAYQAQAAAFLASKGATPPSAEGAPAVAPVAPLPAAAPPAAPPSVAAPKDGKAARPRA